MEIVAFKGRDNAERVAFYKDGEPYNLTGAGATGAEFEAGGSRIPANITGDNNHEVEFQPGNLNARPAGYYGKVIIFTAAKPKGVVIAGPGMEVEILLTLHP
ncbi:hypothetical protein [Arsukibacterium indicum]|uniref:Uncharacterized protein n=1 Tax=Arsukibacterium indicum TaxID=2848612 RepID=A0ABS6MGH1_9GAMM|nr:hypothetical protein [Arsukibacterium indicum]MBV2127908.1 hypothetical protein [Arsukibacterium indicum]